MRRLACQRASPGEPPIAIGGLTNGVSYTVTVTATNDVGTGPASASSNAVVPGMVPGAPTSVGAVAGNGSAVVTFNAPGSNGGSAISSYTVTAIDSTTPAKGGQTAVRAASPITIIGHQR